MSILDPQDLDGGDTQPVHSSTLFGWYRLVGRYENQSIGGIEVVRELALTVALQLVQTARNVPQIFQTHRRPQRIESRPDQLRTPDAMGTRQFGVLLALLLKLPLFKQDIHNPKPRQRIVNVLG